ncbi:hypothetical protein [Stenotrophomonas maltophilia]|uniref:Uncharacterized protein n=1 Tax=Stenotrophomonas maltophilia TaxID=40324 RepID=A0AAJ2MVP3_STEMA|nr:hypothetical protein [Stenotrophomonas maltophilia]MDT3468942.1 hypothetical protein [Stenotrophomonas maltophilia]
MNLEQIDTSTTAGKAEVMRLAAEGRRVASHLRAIGRSFEEDSNPEWSWGVMVYAIIAEPVMGQPDPALLVSMAMRINHGFGLMDRMAQNSLLNDMRKVWEEVVGRGYYEPAKSSRYLRELAQGDATPMRADLAGEKG